MGYLLVDHNSHCVMGYLLVDHNSHCVDFILDHKIYIDHQIHFAYRLCVVVDSEEFAGDSSKSCLSASMEPVSQEEEEENGSEQRDKDEEMEVDGTEGGAEEEKGVNNDTEYNPLIVRRSQRAIKPTKDVDLYLLGAKFGIDFEESGADSSDQEFAPEANLEGKVHSPVHTCTSW